MRPSTRASRLLAALSSAALVLAGSVYVSAIARADETTVSVDTLRTGWDQNEPSLSPSAVSASNFGQLFSTAVNGQVYAQPIAVNGTVIAATENDWIYGINESTGAITWSRSVGAPWPASAIGCTDLTPNVGITGTPVYDPASNAVYFLAKVNDGSDVNNPHWYLHSIDPATGNERSGWPVTVQGSPTNNPGDSFDAKTAMQRPGLLLLGGVVYAGFASHCDYGPYVGYVAGFSTTSPTMTTLWSTESSSSSGQAGIWQGGGGLVSDGAGRIIVSTGNGISPAPGPGTSPPGNLAESVIRLQVNGNGSLSPVDFFSPTNNATLDANDTDFGSGGPMALPAGFGTTAHPHLLMQTGKDGRVFLLDRDNLGGMGQGAGGGDNSIGAPAGPYGGLWGHPAFWGGDGGYAYQVESQAEGPGYLRAFKYGVNGSGLPTLSSAGTSPATFGYTSGSPVVTSNGTTSGSALVWVVYSNDATGAGGQLRAYDPVPVNGQLNLRFSAPIGTAAKFAVPATDGARVFVGTRDGNVYGFGQPTTAPLTGSATNFGGVNVGTTANATVTVTATATVTISAISTSAPFSTTPPSLPVTLNSGATLSVPVQFAPTTAGGANGTLQFTTNSGKVSLSLSGTGVQPGLGATPSALSFGSVPIGSSTALSVTITNTGASSETVNSSTAPSAPFAATGLPANGSTLAAGASVTVSVAYAPTATGSQTGSLVVNGSAGTVTVPLSGTGVTGGAHLSITPNPLAFGSVPVDQSTTQSFDIANTGNVTLTITSATAPTGTFSTTTPVASGQQLAPGAIMQQSVTFSPTAAGAQSAVYSITGNDGQGAVNVQLTGTGSTTVGTTNIAAGKATSASGSQGGYPPSNATDSDVNSYWESTNNAFPQWLQVDLGTPNTVGMITLRLPPQTTWPDRTQTLSVLGSLDGNTFTTLVPSAGYTFSDSTGNYVNINVPPASARYVRLNITANTGWPAGQISSFEVYPVVSGNGSATLSTSPSSLSFAATPINNNSNWQMVTMTNTGSGPAAVSSITASGDFTVASTCGSTLAPGANCVATVTFHPTAAGTRTGTLTITSNASNNPTTVALSGTGTATGSATLSANPASVAFGTINVGTVSAAVPVTVTNTGTATATVSAVSVTTQFAQTNNCGTLAANATCTVNVTFNPTATGNVSGSLTVTSNAANSPLTVALSGTGAASSTTNLALNMPTSESSNTQNYVSANAVDGNQSTYWESANNAFPQWLQVDLGSTQGVGRIVLQLPNSTAWSTRTQTITITGSTDGNNFTTLVASANYTFNPATANTATITFTAANVRYIRLTFTANTGWPAGQCSEFEVFSS